jgi:hypothetical protein
VLLLGAMQKPCEDSNSGVAMVGSDATVSQPQSPRKSMDAAMLCMLESRTQSNISQIQNASCPEPLKPELLRMKGEWKKSKLLRANSTQPATQPGYSIAPA